MGEVEDPPVVIGHLVMEVEDHLVEIEVEDPLESQVENHLGIINLLEMEVENQVENHQENHLESQLENHQEMAVENHLESQLENHLGTLNLLVMEVENQVENHLENHLESQLGNHLGQTHLDNNCILYFRTRLIQ